MIAIHHRKGSYSDEWIEYCEINDIKYKVVNCYDSDIIQQLKKCDALMWHWSHSDFKAKLFAVHLIRAVEKMGVKVFPNISTCWHYDDKLSQKYLLEAESAPLIPTYIFYDKSRALEWSENTLFPKVFKTRNGAGSLNVRLIKCKKEARKIINRCFKHGNPSFDRKQKLYDKLWQLKRDKTYNSFLSFVKHSLKLTLPLKSQYNYSIEKGYAYFQDFIPNLNCDFRIKVVGGRCWGFKRMVRKNDFRASGSGLLDFNPNNIPIQLVELSLTLAKNLNLQSVAFDFVQFQDEFKLIEISYAYGMSKGQTELGYWDSNLEWIEGKFKPEYWMVEDLIKDIPNYSES